jgi:hypothetical protein
MMKKTTKSIAPKTSQNGEYLGSRPDGGSNGGVDEDGGAGGAGGAGGGGGGDGGVVEDRDGSGAGKIVGRKIGGD